jgi:uncharacterized membrane protein YkvA (DUF1232 family)
MNWLSRPWLLRMLLAQLRLAIRLLRDPGVPVAAKAVPILAALYLISPLDLIPDLFPVFGQLDDLAIVVLALEAFVNLCPAGIRASHEDAIARGRTYSPTAAADEVIDAEWRRE